MAAPEIIRLIIDDVPLVIAFADPEIEKSRELAQHAVVERGWNVEPAFVWLDEGGLMQFSARPEQRRFFQALNYSQLRALLPTT